MKYPKRLANAIDRGRIPILRRRIIDAIQKPPHVGRKASSKSLSFVLAPKNGLGDLTKVLLETFRTSSMAAAARQIFGQDYVLLLDNCSVRWHQSEAPGSALKMHFDGMFLGAEPAVNIWLTLDDVGEQVPGLTFIGNKTFEAALWAKYCARQSEIGWKTIDPSNLDQLLSPGAMETLRKQTLTPEVQAGDALVFDTATLHATQAMEGWRGERVSVEFRLSAADAIPILYRRRGHMLARFPTEGPIQLRNIHKGSGWLDWPESAG